MSPQSGQLQGKPLLSALRTGSEGLTLQAACISPMSEWGRHPSSLTHGSSGRFRQVWVREQVWAQEQVEEASSPDWGMGHFVLICTHTHSQTHTWTPMKHMHALHTCTRLHTQIHAYQAAHVCMHAPGLEPCYFRSPKGQGSSLGYMALAAPELGQQQRNLGPHWGNVTLARTLAEVPVVLLGMRTTPVTDGGVPAVETHTDTLGGHVTVCVTQGTAVT